MLKRMWLVPFLSAIYWGSCRNPEPPLSCSHEELDIRYAICAFVMALIVIITVQALARMPVETTDKGGPG